MAVESEAAFQRNRLRSLDAAFLWFVSLFSVFVSLFAVAFGRDLAISLMPMLIPIFVMPITEGVLLGVVFRDSLRWRARGWATFGLGIATVLGLVAAQASLPFAPPPTLVTFLFVLVIIGLLVLFAGERLVRFYGVKFTEIQTDERIRPKGEDQGFVLEGALCGSLAGLAFGLWSLSISGISGLSWTIYLPLLILVVILWPASIARDLKNKRSKETREWESVIREQFGEELGDVAVRKFGTTLGTILADLIKESRVRSRKPPRGEG